MARKPRDKRKTRKTPRRNVTSQNIQPSENEFSLIFHPTDVETLLDSECLSLMGTIQFKWVVAEREVHHIMIHLNQKGKTKRSDIGSDIPNLHKHSQKRPELRPYKDAICRLHKAFMEVSDDRNTLVHGKLITESSATSTIAVDLSQDSKPVPFSPFFRQGEMMLVRKDKRGKDKRVLLKACPLRKINQRVSVLLQSIYELWQDINPLIVFEGNMSIENASDPSINLGDGRKAIPYKVPVRLRDLLNSAPVTNYRCNVCNAVEVARSEQPPPVHCDIPMIAY